MNSNDSIIPRASLGLRSLKLLAGITGLALACTGSAHAALGIVTYTFGGTPASLAASGLAANATASSVSLGSGETQFTSIGGALIVFPVALNTTAAAAVANNAYFQFTVTPAAGYALNLTGIAFQGVGFHSGASSGYALASSLDNYGSLIQTAALPYGYPSFSPYSVSLAGAAYQNLGAAITFRLYDYNPTAAGLQPNSAYENLVLGGTVTAAAVPEPTTLALLGMGGMALLGLRRRRA